MRVRRQRNYNWRAECDPEIQEQMMIVVMMMMTIIIIGARLAQT